MDKKNMTFQQLCDRIDTLERNQVTLFVEVNHAGPVPPCDYDKVFVNGDKPPCKVIVRAGKRTLEFEPKIQPSGGYARWIDE